VRGAILVSDHVERRHAAALERAAPGMPRVVLREGGTDGDPSTVEVAYFSGDLFPERTRELVIALAKAERLAWLHSMSAGVDHPWFRSLLLRGVRLTTSSGASAVPIAHTVLLYLLALSRGLLGWLEGQRAREWRPHVVHDLQGDLLGVVGLGPIGLEVARLGTAFGMRVVGLRRTPRGDEPCETWRLDRLPELAALADHLVLALPLTEETRHLVGAQVLAGMKPSAVLVNVGRGALVDEPALVAALAERRIAGAALDVFEVEPLPAESPLWSLPNVIVTPHSAGTSPANWERASALFADNLARYVRGEPLRNEVTP
jgi:phosphoglycerate dehydrogenase-like enzyme